jgi:hypothetical protein
MTSCFLAEPAGPTLEKKKRAFSHILGVRLLISEMRKELS